MQESRPVPKALQCMIEQYNKQLYELQERGTADIIEASLEIMTMLDINPDAGWKLDIAQMLYTRTVPDTTQDNAPIIE